MYILSQIVHCFFPLIALILLTIGVKRHGISYIISALWLCIIALIIHFQFSGSQILGSYFGYVNAAIYTLNLIVLFISLNLVIVHLSLDNGLFHLGSSFLKAMVSIASLLVIINLWTNAFFIENRMQGTPIMQVALFNKADYCSYKYIFYKVSTDGNIAYLCPNHFGLIPSIGRLSVSPDFITTQLSLPVKKRILLLQQKNS